MEQVQISADLLKMDYKGVKVSFSLDGLDGDTPLGILHEAVMKDMMGRANYTQWELATFKYAGVLEKIDFYHGGKLIDNPWVG
ncbi:hypothetical protein [Streptomyces sp. NPDC059479]|uniref:hypothetical protein n=1 Tax=Streptomyces sp. NPDC059479 TaxID=3346848 RepID=UPI0036B3EAB9